MATSAAATMPARRDARTTPAPYAIGIVAVPASAESDRKPDLPEPEGLPPDPGDDVVEVRGGLGPRNLVQHVPEPAVEERPCDELVEPEALPIQRRQAKNGAEQGEPEDRPVPHRGRTHQADERRAGPRSPASAASAVTMKRG